MGFGSVLCNNSFAFKQVELFLIIRGLSKRIRALRPCHLVRIRLLQASHLIRLNPKYRNVSKVGIGTLFRVTFGHIHFLSVNVVCTDLHFTYWLILTRHFP